jgi:hypothetical protein
VDTDDKGNWINLDLVAYVTFHDIGNGHKKANLYLPTVQPEIMHDRSKHDQNLIQHIQQTTISDDFALLAK